MKSAGAHGGTFYPDEFVRTGVFEVLEEFTDPDQLPDTPAMRTAMAEAQRAKGTNGSP